MMVKASPAAAFIMTETNLLLEFKIVTFDPPTHLGLIDHALERDVGRQGREPVVIRFGFALRPFDQQPLLWRRLAASGVVVCRTHAPSGKPRGQWGVAAVPPRNLLPGISGELQSQCLGRHRLIRRVAAACRAAHGRCGTPVVTAPRRDARPSWWTGCRPRSSARVC